MRDGLGLPQSLAVFGGTSEIGLAVAHALAANRALRVVLAVRDPDAAATAQDGLRAAGADVALTAFEAADTGSHAQAVDEVFAGGDIDMALVAFGVLGPQGDEQLGAAAGLHQVNGAGAVSVMAELAERMRRQGHGVIVLLSSVAADRPRVSNYAYGSSKSAADAFARGLADALAGTGVEVLIVRPGFVRTRMTEGMDPAPMSVDPDDVARVIVTALGARNHIVYVPSALRWVMLVIRALPRAVARRLPR